MPDVRIAGRLEIVRAEVRHWELTGCFRIKVPRAGRHEPRLLVNLALERHEGMDERLRPWSTARDMHVHRQVTVDALEHIVTLLERPAGNRAGAHRDHVLGL